MKPVLRRVGLAVKIAKIRVNRARKRIFPGRATNIRHNRSEKRMAKAISELAEADKEK